MKLRTTTATERFIQVYGRTLPHAVLITGQHGTGLSTIARYMANSNGNILSIVRPESKSSAVASISVETIRQLYVVTRSRLNGKNFVIIDDSDRMNHSAQNALLKLLEEPNDSICFILTSHNPDLLLPTIRSRTQTHTVGPVSDIDSRRLLKSLKVTDDLAIQRMLYVATGLPAELSRLASNTADFNALLERVQQAKQLIEGTTYQRMAACMKMANDRTATLHTLDTAMLLLRRTLASKSDRDTLLKIDNLLQAHESIKANGSIKLHLMRAMLQ